METSNFFEALYNYYNRNEDKMPRPGLSSGVPLKNVIVIDEQGRFLRFEFNYEKDGKRVRCHDNVPFDIQVTSGIKAHLLYGKFEYFFPFADEKKGTAKNDAFKKEIQFALDNSDDRADFESILKFYETGECVKAMDAVMDWAKSQKDAEMERAKDEKTRRDIDKKSLIGDYVNGDFTFKFHGRKGLFIEEWDNASGLPKHYGVFKKWYDKQQSDNFSGYGMDSITGEYGRLISVFPSKSMQATLIGFNSDTNKSLISHGHENMANCPMTSETAFKISSAFNYLRGNSKHNFRIGSADEESALVFWSSSDEGRKADEENDDNWLDEMRRLGFSFASNEGDSNAGSESSDAENDHDKKVRSVLKGSKQYEREVHSTYYAAFISTPRKGSVYVSQFKSGKLSNLYDNIEKYQRDFATFKDEKFVSPYMALEACYKRSGGKPVKGETDSKKHINMRRELLMAAIFGGRYGETIFAEIIDRIYRECSLEYDYSKGVNKSDRMACVRAFASQSHVLDEFKFERDMDSLPYQTGAFYGVCEAIRQKYETMKKDSKAIWKIRTTEFRKGLANQTNEFIIEKLKREAKVLAGYLGEDEKRCLVGDYGKEEVWHTITKPNGAVVRRGEWKITHDEDKGKWGEIDWAIYRMKSLKENRKASWSLDDKAMYLLGFYRMFKNLMSYTCGAH